MKILAYADDLILLIDNVEDLQRGTDSLNDACEEFGMKISVGKTKVMHVGKAKEEVVCSLSGEGLGQVSALVWVCAKDAKR